MEILKNAVRNYRWGSRTLIAELQGRPAPSPQPEAELWLGAHSGEPSYLTTDDGQRVSLLSEIRRDPISRLGPDHTRRWRGQLPFLLKILAADEPLSLQAHPSAAQAEAGFAREKAAGIRVDDPQRSYKDANHKPELACALTEFHALSGFRPVADTVRLLRNLDVPELSGDLQLLTEQPDPDGLREVFSAWIDLAPDQLLMS